MNAIYFRSLALLISLQPISGSQLIAQQDSSGRLRFSGLVVDMQLRAVDDWNSYADSQIFQKHVSDELLNSSFHDSVTGIGQAVSMHPTYYSMPFTLGFRLTGDRPIKDQKTIEVHAGLRFGGDRALTRSQLRMYNDTLSATFDQNTQATVYEINRHKMSYFFVIESKKVLVPFGVSLFSNRNKLVFFSAGVEISPGLNFAYTYYGYYDHYYSQITRRSDESPPPLSEGPYSHHQLESASSRRPVRGIGFTGYAAFPVSINIRFSEKNTMFRKFALSLSLAPGFHFRSNKFHANVGGRLLNINAGFRYVLID
jgi:hypothetical protein